ncbi:hypothetical protein Tco_0089309 [Tanacetum coccineum]
MHTSKDDYLINSLRFVSAKESTQIYGAILPECLTSPAMKESKAYMTYLSYATGVVPPKIAKKFKKASPSKKDSDLVPVNEEPIQKGKRVKRPAKKSTTKLAACVIIREAPVETKSKSKENEKGNDEDDSNNDDQDSSNEDSEQENEIEEQVSDSEQEEEYEDDE